MFSALALKGFSPFPFCTLSLCFPFSPFVLCHCANSWLSRVFPLFPFSLFPLFPSVFERLVNSYYHAKFWVSSSKIERVMLNFIFCSVPSLLRPSAVPVTNLPVELCASRQLIRKHKKFLANFPYSRKGKKCV